MAVSAHLRAGVVACALALAGCAGTADLPDTDAAASASPFTRALFGNYAFLVRSLKDHDAEVSGASESLTEIFGRKAEAAGRGEDVQPEGAPSSVFGADIARAQLDTAFAGGARERAPVAAARAQVGYDCWVLNARAGRQRAAASCKVTFDGSMSMLQMLNPQSSSLAPIVVAEAVDPPDYTVFFGFDEWALSGAALQAITDAVQYAHDSRASHIDVLGHADTSGGAAYNQRLSERRAKVVREVMIQMGARPAAVTAKGMGERDLAVPTQDGVRETRNRRSVVTLIPLESRVSAR
jgi:OOP family OmpA-OmpF porin